MAGWAKIKRTFSLLLLFSFVSIALLFALLETSPRRDSRDLIPTSFPGGKMRDPGNEVDLIRHLTTTRPAPLDWDNDDDDDGDDGATNTASGSAQPMQPQTKKRQILLIVAHGRSGTTFLADIFNKHPRVFYVFEPLHVIRNIQAKDYYDKFARNLLDHIFQCDFSVENSTRHIGQFYRFYSRALSSPPFCKYKQADPRWKREYCLPVTQQFLEHSCREQHDTIVYKLLMERIPGQSIEQLFQVCEMAGIECKVIYLIRDIRPVVMSSRKVAFFREVDQKDKPSMRQFVYSRCEMNEMNLLLVKNFHPSVRSRVTLVRYEDLVVKPLEVLDDLYKFAGLEVLENTKQWLVNITQPSINDLKKEERNPVSVVRNSLEVLNKWRLLADPCHVNVIERYCRDVMKLMGYIATEGSVEMLRNLEIPLFTKDYQAQNFFKG